MLRPLTFGTDLTVTPAISPDGKLVAFASDRATRNNLDIWVQPVAQGSVPHRLTSAEADDSAPSFSPDGAWLVFHSNRDGGGIYIVPVTGGEERLLVRGGKWPRFSPDGETIGFTLTTNVALAAAGVYVVAAAGGTPRRLAADVPWAVNTLFSPAGNDILCLGRDEKDEWDWWLTPVRGGPSRKTGLLPALQHQGVEPWQPSAWIGDRIFFGYRRDLWSVKVSPPEWKIAGSPRQVTKDARGFQFGVAVTGEALRVAYSVGNWGSHLWSLSVEANTGKATGEPAMIPNLGGAQSGPTGSADGRTLVYLQGEAGAASVRVRDMETGKERALLSGWARPRLSPDGATVAFSDGFGRQSGVNLIPVAGGEAKHLLDFEKRGNLVDWTPDGRHIVYWDGQPIRFALLDPRTGKTRPLISHPKYDIHDAAISPDQRWMAFQLPQLPHSSIRIALLKEDGAAGEAEWITAVAADAENRRPWWSPDGNLLYFTSMRDGFRCFYALRLHPATKRPVGAPFAVHHFHSARLSLPVGAMLGPAIFPDRIVFALSENTGNVWIGEPR